MSVWEMGMGIGLLFGHWGSDQGVGMWNCYKRMVLCSCLPPYFLLPTATIIFWPDSNPQIVALFSFPRPWLPQPRSHQLSSADILGRGSWPFWGILFLPALIASNTSPYSIAHSHTLQANESSLAAELLKKVTGSVRN